MARWPISAACVALLACAGSPAVPRAVPPGPAPGPVMPSSGAYAHYIRSQLYLGRSQPRQAVQELEAALEFDPGSPYLLVRLAEVRLQQGYTNRALELCRKALALDPAFPDAYLLTGRIHRSSRTYPLAVEAFEQAIRAASSRPEAYLALGELHREYGRKSEAAHTYQRMADHLPRYPTALFLLGELALDREDYEAAERYYRRALEADTTLEEARLQLGRVLEAEGKLAEAVAAYTELHYYHPLDEEAVYTLLRLHLLLGQEVQADHYRRALAESHPDDTETLARIGETCFEARAYGCAAEAFEAVLALDGSLDKVRVYLGSARYAQGDVDAALAEYGRVPATSEYWDAARLEVGRVLQAQGRLDEAARIYRDLLPRRPKDKGLYRALADLRLARGDAQGAFRTLRRGLEHMPGDLHLLFHLGALTVRAGDFDDGVTRVGRVLKADPDHFGALLFLAQEFAARGVRLEEAERYAERAQRLRPNDADVAAVLGRIYLLAGRATEALGELQEAHRLAPEEPGHLERLAEVLDALGQPGQAAATRAQARVLADRRPRPAAPWPRPEP